jgi:hypothetical protein
MTHVDTTVGIDAAAPGERLVVAPEAEGMPTFRSRVLAAGPAGQQDDTLGESRSRLTQSEWFSGLLAGLLLRRYGGRHGG